MADAPATQHAVGSIPLTFRPWPEGDHSSSSLDNLPQINQQYKHFRFVTESSLEDQIKAQKDGDEKEEELRESEDESEAVNAKGTIEDVVARKQKLWSLVNTAHNEGLTLVDMLSLLDSSSETYQRQALQTMSPELKNRSIPGTLQQRQWEMRDPSRETVEESNVISLGSTMRSLTGAADTLLRAANRLEQEVRRERVYWDAVLGLTERGWSVFKYGRDRRSLAVQFSAQEASPPFSSRGITALRSNADGTIKLERSLAIVPKTFHVRIKKGEVVVASASAPLYGISSDSASDLEIMIRRARDSLFEEELFHEMVLETRTLQHFGAQYRDHTIQVPSAIDPASKASYTLLLNLATVDPLPEKRASSAADTVGQGVATFGRMLLCHLFRQRLRKRSQIPAPLSERKQVEAQQSILRPIIAHFQHFCASRDVYAALCRIDNALTGAGLSAKQRTRYVTPLEGIEKAVAVAQTSEQTVFALVDMLCHPLKSSITFRLPSSGPSNEGRGVITVEVLTSIPDVPVARNQESVHGTLFSLEAPEELLQKMLGLPNPPDRHTQTLPFGFYEEVISYIQGLLAWDIAHNVLQPHLSGWKAIARQAQMVKVDDTVGGYDQARLGIDLQDGALRLWKRRASSQIPDASVSWNGERSQETLVAAASRLCS